MAKTRTALSFAERLTVDRLSRLMRWSEYAVFLGVSESTLYAWLAGREPTDLMRAKVERRLALPVKIETVAK